MSLGNEGVPFTMPVEPAGSSNNCGNSGWGGDWSAWIIIFVLFFAFGGWGNGFGGGWGNGGAGVQGALTRADLCSEFNFNGLENSVRGVQQGICDSTFALNNSINGLGVNTMQGFNSVNQGICNLGYTVQQGFNATQTAMLQGDNATQMAIMQGNNALQAQLADCCCKTNNNIERGFADVGYRMATDTCAVTTAIANSTRDTIDNQNSNARAILDALNQNYIRTLESENQSLKLSASQQAQNAVLMAAMDANKADILRRTGAECPTPAYVVQPPTPVNFPTNCCGQFNGGWGNSCSCGQCA